MRTGSRLGEAIQVCAVPVLSAALLVYRQVEDTIEHFLVHPGGPFWSRKDEGAWSLPKGIVNAGEAPLDAARREFQEETGFPVPPGACLDLGEVKLRSNKVIRAWAVEGSVDPAQTRSNLFRLEWPPRSGAFREYPEADRGAYFRPEEAARKLHEAQRPFVQRLVERLRGEAKEV